MRERLKPKYDAQMASIVKIMQAETDELMETAGDLSGEVEIRDPDQMDEEKEVEMDNSSKQEPKKIKIPHVDVNKIAKFMSQRKYRTFKAKEKIKKKRLKSGQKKKKEFKW